MDKRNITYFDGGWRTFKFSFDKALQEDDVKCWGKTDFDKGIIHLEDSMSGEILRETIIHEITHILLETIGYGDYDDTDEAVILHNEKLTVLVSRAFLQAMNLNSELFSILL